MVVRNDLDRFHLASDVIDRVPKLGYMAAYAKQALRDQLIEHKQYITRHGDDMPDVKDWRWPGPTPKTAVLDRRERPVCPLRQPASRYGRERD
jgi:xylulose-5-phosphate/fructose-6-phosphate phosphoketolase